MLLKCLNLASFLGILRVMSSSASSGDDDHKRQKLSPSSLSLSADEAGQGGNTGGAEEADQGDSTGGRGGGGDCLKKGPWMSAEDDILIAHVKKHGEGNWSAVQKYTGLARCGKSCRLRWTNHLRPDLRKGAITAEEEHRILELHFKMGNKWAQIAALVCSNLTSLLITLSLSIYFLFIFLMLANLSICSCNIIAVSLHFIAFIDYLAAMIILLKVSTYRILCY